MIERLFRLSENETSTRTEVLAGVTAFVTMSYIIFVQRSVLSGKCSVSTRAWTSARSRRPRVSQRHWPLLSWRSTRVTPSRRRRAWVKISFSSFRRFPQRQQLGSPTDGRLARAPSQVLLKARLAWRQAVGQG